MPVAAQATPTITQHATARPDERARLEREITAAEASLAETENRLTINEQDLCRALELSHDVATADADEQTKRSYNQAFCERIKIRARWDDDAHQTVAEVASVELTAPYALLLDDQTEKEALAWVKAIKAGKRPQVAEGPAWRRFLVPTFRSMK